MQTLKQKIKRRFISVMFHTRAHKLFRPFFSGVGHILMFHRVIPPGSGPRIPFNTHKEVTPEYLEQVVIYLKKRGYRFISLDDLYEMFRQNQLKKKFVAVTFDDGYRDNLTHALPVLKKHEVPFTVYVSTNFPNGTAVLWWDLLEEVLLAEDKMEFTINGKHYSYECAGMEQKEETFQAIRSVINGFSRESFLNNIRIIFDGKVENLYGKTRELALNWEQIKELSREPLVTIGAHTLNHYALKHLSDREAEFEIRESKKEIESHIGQPVEHFAYPFGGPLEVSLRDVETAEQSGFKTVTAAVEGNVFREHKDQLAFLPRLQVSGMDEPNRLELFIDGLNQFRYNRFNKVFRL